MNDSSPTERMLFTDLHVHSDDTVGTGNADYNLRYGRDVADLDVLGFTVNDFNIIEENWRHAVGLIEGIDEPGRFVCYPGTEWCAPGTQVFGVVSGLTGVIAERLDRQTVGVALRARRTWATTGERAVALLWSGDALQGDSAQASAPVPVSWRVLNDAGGESVSARDQDGCLWQRDLVAEAGHSARRIRFSWAGRVSGTAIAQHFGRAARPSVTAPSSGYVLPAWTIARSLCGGTG